MQVAAFVSVYVIGILYLIASDVGDHHLINLRVPKNLKEFIRTSVLITWKVGFYIYAIVQFVLIRVVELTW